MSTNTEHDERASPKTDHTALFRKWDCWLNGSPAHESMVMDRNGIWLLIGNIVEDMASFEVYRKICENEESPFNTPIIKRMITWNYIDMQTMRIRRLVDVNDESNESRSVYSLRRLFDDICKQHFDMDEIAFQILRVRHIEGLQLIQRRYGSMLNRYGKLKPKIQHTIQARILIDKSKTLRLVTDYANKRVAHSASHESMAAYSYNDPKTENLTAAIDQSVQGLVEAFHALHYFVTYTETEALLDETQEWELYLKHLDDVSRRDAYQTMHELGRRCEQWMQNSFNILGLEQLYDNSLHLRPAFHASDRYRIYLDTEYFYPDMKRSDPRPTGKEKRQIVQIAAILYDISTGEEVASFDRLVLPLETDDITPFFEELTGIQKSDVEQKGRSFKDVLQDFVTFCADYPIWTFHQDQEVFEQNCGYYNLKTPFKQNFIRVKQLLKYWNIDPDAYSSGTLHRAAGLEMEGHIHNALHDVRSMAAAIKILEERNG